MAQMAQLYCRNVKISTEKEPVGCESSASCGWIVSFCVVWLSCRQGGSACPMCWEGMVSVPARDPDQWDEEAAQLYLHTHQATRLLEAQGHELCCREQAEGVQENCWQWVCVLLSTYVFIHCCILGRILVFCLFVCSWVVGVGRRTDVMGAQCPQHLKNTQFSVTVCSCGWNGVHGCHCLFLVVVFPFRVRRAGGVSCFAMLIAWNSAVHQMIVITLHYFHPTTTSTPPTQPNPMHLPHQTKKHTMKLQKKPRNT